jgi:lysophospholipase L1-like esterase
MISRQPNFIRFSQAFTGDTFFMRFGPSRASATLAISSLAAILLAAGAGSRPTYAQSTYLALGDSYAFGYQNITTTPPIGFGGTSNGDQGYVNLFANYLAQQNGGTRPTVVNLARPGETTVSFSGSAAAPTTPFNFNTNYAPGGFTQSQGALLSTTLAGLPTAPKYVTIQLGGNDVLGALFNNPASLPAVFATLQTNYSLILASVRATLPNADIYVLGYGNPFPGLPLNSPYNTPSGQIAAAVATAQGNALISALAGGIGAKYVDLSNVFTGQEAQLTNIQQTEVTGLPNYHPNAQGYQSIANRLIATAAPEPTSLALILTVFTAVGIVGRRRYRRLSARP